jgi:hypothetical protein
MGDADTDANGIERRSDVVDTYEANGDTVIVKENQYGVEKGYVEVDVSETQTVEVRRRSRNPLTGRRHDLTKLSDDGYLKPFLAVQGKMHSHVVDLDRSPVLCLDKDRWQLEERDGQYVAINRSAEGHFSEMILENAAQSNTETDRGDSS